MSTVGQGRRGALMERIFVHTEERRRILEPGFVSREGVSSKPSF